MSSSAARVWMTTGSPARRGQLELRLERAPLVLARGAVAVVVESGLADRARPRVRGGALDLLQAGVVEALAVVGVAAHDRHHALVLAQHPRAPAGSTRRSCPPWRAGSRPPAARELTTSAVGVLAGVEVAVGVDHRAGLASGRGVGLGWLDLGEELAQVADASRRRPRAEPRAVSSDRSSRPSAVSSFSADSGTHGCSSTDTTRSPSARAYSTRVELGRLRLVLRELPGLLVGHEAVERTHALPDVLESRAHVGMVEALPHRVGEPVELRRQRRPAPAPRAPRRRGSASIIASERLARLPYSLASSVL